MTRTIQHMAFALAAALLAVPLMMASVAAAQAQTQPAATDPAIRYWNASVAAELRGALDEAQTAIYAYTNAGGDRYFAALRSGWLAWVRKDYEKALRFYKTAIDAVPHGAAQSVSLTLVPRLGQMYSASAAGRGTEALQAAGAVLALVPGHREATLFAAQARTARGESARAIELLRRASGEAPDDTGLLTALISALNAAGRRSEAEPLQARLRSLTGVTTASATGVNSVPGATGSTAPAAGARGKR